MFQTVKALTVGFFTVFGLWVTVPAYAEDAFAECTECHTSDVMIKKHSFEIVDACITCHNEQKDHAKNHVKIKQNTDTHHLISDKLAYPMYYDKSRLGSKPNKMVEIYHGQQYSHAR